MIVIDLFSQLGAKTLTYCIIPAVFNIVACN